MRSAEIARRFVRFFEERGHTVVPSAPLPIDDPTLLFANAGMVQFKPYFLGQEKAPYPRAVTVQKCLRTIDIDEVGKTDRHGSFFKMNGNFSFGDYFKEKAIEYAWELVTRPQSDGGLGFDESVLYVSVYKDDEEAVQLWKRIAGLSDDRIVRLGMKDNFWSMGVPGPCGPSSEILIDRGPEFGADRDWDAGDRYMELWNLVFMQNLRGPGGEKEGYEILGDLPAKNIDTGMGHERVAFLLQGGNSFYECDEVLPVLEKAAELSGKRYGANHEDDVRLRVVADHVRTALMVVADGVVPGNEGRGYVLRRIIRRAVRSMRLLGVDAPTMPELLPVSERVMAESYPELDREWNRISTVVYTEEEAFRDTLRTGTQIFDQAVTETKKSGQQVLSGGKAFQLHDTYGFPIDLTLEMAAEQGLSVDEEGFRRLMTEQRNRAKADAKQKKMGQVDLSAYSKLLDTTDKSEFVGYTTTSAEARVLGILVEGVSVDVAGPGSKVELVLDRTPFYAEAGGQLPDHGRIRAGDATVDVEDVQTPVTGLIVHRGQVVDGEVRVGAEVYAEVDVDRRRSISRSHTATHMVHKAVREILGDTATQAGSENSPGRLRFDFHASGAMAGQALQDAEDRINSLVAEDLGVEAAVMPKDDALKMGAMALFGAKYGDRVRVVSIGGPWSREFCGGTHAAHTSLLGVVKLLGESSIGSGVRRVEALVGTDAMNYLSRESLLVSQLSDLLKAPRGELRDRVEQTISRLREAEKEISRLRSAQLAAGVERIVESAHDVAGVSVVTHQAPDGTTPDDLRTLALDVRGRLGERSGVVVIGAVANGRPVIVVTVNEAGRKAGIRAGELVSVGAKALGGGGGGKDDIAQGGGSKPEAMTEAFTAVEQAIDRRAAG